MTKLKAFADNKLTVAKVIISLFDRGENTVGKGENAGNQNIVTLLIFFPSTDDSHCDRIHSSLTTVECFDNGHVGKRPVAWKEYCVEHWLTVYLNC